MNLDAFNNLELIPKIFNELQLIQLELSHIKAIYKVSAPNLKTRKGVKEYLNISDGTINNMMQDGRFKQGVHYTKVINKFRAKIIFIESAIIRYKENK